MSEHSTFSSMHIMRHQKPHVMQQQAIQYKKTQHDMTEVGRAECETSAEFVNLIDEHHRVAGACGLETLHHLAGHCTHICPAMSCRHCPLVRLLHALPSRRGGGEGERSDS